VLVYVLMCCCVAVLMRWRACSWRHNCVDDIVLMCWCGVLVDRVGSCLCGIRIRSFRFAYDLPVEMKHGNWYPGLLFRRYVNLYKKGWRMPKKGSEYCWKIGARHPRLGAGIFTLQCCHLITFGCVLSLLVSSVYVVSHTEVSDPNSEPVRHGLGSRDLASALFVLTGGKFVWNSCRVAELVSNWCRIGAELVQNWWRIGA
jgi:hypothetical protein